MCITGHSSGTAESSRISTFDIHAHDILMWVCRVQLQLNGIIGFFKKQELIEKIGPKFTPAKTLRIGNFGSALIQGDGQFFLVFDISHGEMAAFLYNV